MRFMWFDDGLMMVLYDGFPQMRVPQNGWFISENHL